jgi:hypothetical protein
MRSRTTLVTVALACFALGPAITLLHAQAAGPQQPSKVFGYEDTKTGIFHALTPEAVSPAASTASTGTLKVTLNITVKSTWPANTTRTVVCSSEFLENSLTSSGGASTYIEEASRYATATTSGFTCTMTIPYSWLIPSTAIQNSLTGTYSVGVQNSTTTAGPVILRMSTGPVVSTTTLPAAGTTTTYAIAVVI